MRLISAQVTGVGRLSNAKINLDRKLIAIVGPNEAGKTTLLHAIERITSGRLLPPSERSRGEDIRDNDTIIRVTFALESNDENALKSLGASTLPTHVTYSRRANGTSLYMEMTPEPTRDFGNLGVLRDQLIKQKNRIYHRGASYAEKLGIELNALSEHFDDLQSVIATITTLTEECVEATDEQLAEVERVETLWKDTDSTSPLIPILNKIGGWLDSRFEMEKARKRLVNRTPDFLLFDDDSRNLQSSYELSRPLAASPPKALGHLVEIAGLDLNELCQASEQSNRAQKETLLLGANLALERAFSTAWKQSNLAVQIDLENTTLLVDIKENNQTITPFDQRSAGLRMFVSLWLFIKAANVEEKPILLVDEAELHLHLDAQADLVRVLSTHDGVANVIYTTHSPGCLPPDLGTGVRVISPSKHDHNTSEISNNFWTSSFGFSPLMMAMGAGASAFSTVKYAALTEGASEMLILPTLIRLANELDHLDYQVAPGLSEAPKRIYPELDLAAARVAYVVDGDSGGKALRTSLIKAGIPASKIVQLRAVTLENILNPDCYSKVCEELVKECNPSKNIPPLPLFKQENGPWPTVLDRWGKENSLSVPSKIAVASRLVERDHAIPSAKGKRALKKLHSELMVALRIPDSLPTI